MRQTRLLLVFPLLFALILALSAACSSDDSLSDEEYFQKMDEIDKDLDAQFDEVFSGEDATAGDLRDGFATAVDSARTQYGDVKPPSDLEDEHDELLVAIDEFGVALDEAEINADAPAEEFEAVFAEDAVSAANDRVTDAFCAIQAIADEKGIEADVGCDEGGEEAVDPSTVDPVEASAVLIQDFAFDPPHIQVAVGDTITWTQGADGAPHTVTATDDAKTFDSGTLTDEGETFEFTFPEAGEFPYYCEIHPDMLGLVTVTE
jgi:plastocyanin